MVNTNTIIIQTDHFYLFIVIFFSFLFTANILVFVPRPPSIHFYETAKPPPIVRQQNPNHPPSSHITLSHTIRCCWAVGAASERRPRHFPSSLFFLSQYPPPIVAVVVRRSFPIDTHTCKNGEERS